MFINILFVATAENRVFKIDDMDNDLPNLIDDYGLINNDTSSDLDKFKLKYFEIIALLYNNNDNIKYMTLDPAYSNVKIKNQDDIRYIGHESLLLEEINLDKYNKSFDLIFIANTYNNMFNTKNIDIINKLLKPKSYLITTYPTGYDELIVSNYKFIKTCSNYNINIFTS